MPVAPPSPASTVVLLRAGAVDAPPEILLLKRTDKSSWLGGVWVFPGGRVDDGDREPAWDELALGTARLQGAWSEVNAGWLRDHAVAAVREVFEETGVLLAETVTQRRADMPPDYAPPGPAGDERRELLDGLASFAALCEHRRWRLRLDLVVPFSRWITPEQERRRFDTVFFMTSAPADVLDMHEREMSAHAWLTPAEAVAGFGRGEIALAPPTLRTLEDLSACATVEEALAWAQTVPRRVIAPKLHEGDGTKWLVLPGDPLYPVPVSPDEALPPPTRFVFDRGCWRSDLLP